MKKITLTLIFFLFTFLAFSQPPQAFSYQAIAYDGTGTLVTNPISLRISILEGSIAGTPVYTETFSGVPTTAQGVFSINIGGGTPTLGTFPAINWGSGSKFIKVEMDATSPGTGTTYFDVGANQLMSVPYALYSGGAGNGVEMVTDIAALRALPVVLPKDKDKVIYLKGYYSGNEGDGGEGFFIFKENETIVDVGGIFIKPVTITPTPSTDKGRWVRQYSGPINAIYFGVVKFPLLVPPNGPSNADRINNAIQYVNGYNLGYLWGNPNSISPHTVSPQDMSLYFPSGSYDINKTIMLYPEVTIKGDFATRFKPTSEFIGDYVFKIVPGPLERFGIENIEMDFGVTTRAIGGIHFKAEVSSTGAAGGASNGTFKKIRMRNCKGHGIYLEGGVDALGIRANQYLHFEDVFIERKPGNYNCLRITGAAYNNVFINCDFQIPFEVHKPEISDFGSNIFISTSNAIPQAQCDQLSFINCATGGVPNKGVFFGAKIEKANSITFENCWFEATEIGLSITDSRAINVLNCFFANAAGLGSLGAFGQSATGREGACITVEESFVTIERNYSNVSAPASPYIEKELFIKGLGKNNVINARNNSFQDIRLSETFGITQYVPITIIDTYNINSPATQQGIDTGGKKVVLVTRGVGAEIFRINSTISAGEMIFIRAEEESIKIWSWDPVSETDSRNIYLSGKVFIDLSPGQGAMFLKMDGVNGDEKCVYQLVSVTD